MGWYHAHQFTLEITAIKPINSYQILVSSSSNTWQRAGKSKARFSLARLEINKQYQALHFNIRYWMWVFLCFYFNGILLPP